MALVLIDSLPVHGSKTHTWFPDTLASFKTSGKASMELTPGIRV
jgi:hypothetical protein